MHAWNWIMHLTDDQMDLVKEQDILNTFRHLVTLEMEESEGIDTLIKKLNLSLRASIITK